MTVFQIQQNSVKTPLDTAVEPGKEKTTEEEGTAVPQTPTAGEQQIVSAAGGDEGGGEGPEKEIVVKVSGKLGQAFTDALNKMLATESYLTVGTPVAQEREESFLQEIHDKEILQVFCWDADKLNVDDMVEISNEITRNTNRSYVLSFETAGTIPTILEAAEKLARLPNVTLCLSRSAALSAVQRKVTK